MFTDLSCLHHFDISTYTVPLAVLSLPYHIWDWPSSYLSRYLRRLQHRQHCLVHRRSLQSVYSAYVLLVVDQKSDCRLTTLRSYPLTICPGFRHDICSVYIRSNTDWPLQCSDVISILWYAFPIKRKHRVTNVLAKTMSHDFAYIARVHFSNYIAGQQFILYLLLQVGSIQFVSFITLIVRRATFNKRFSEQHRLFPTRRNRSIAKDTEAAQIVLSDPVETGGPAASKSQQQGSSSQDSDQQDNAENPSPPTDSSAVGHDAEQGQQEQDQADKQSSDENSSDVSLQYAGRGGFPNPLQSLYSEGWNQLRKRYRSNNEQGTAPLIDAEKTTGLSEKQGQGEKVVSSKKAAEIKANFGRNSNVMEILDREQHASLAKLEVCLAIISSLTLSLSRHILLC